EVERVDLLTRQIFDSKVSSDYSEPIEPISDNANIIRLPFGPRRYLRKEALWPHMDSMADQALKFIRSIGRVPDVIHSHYADAGYVGSRLAGLLGVPQIHTGHSLGREKQRRLHEQGLKHSTIEKYYNISKRIEAEEMTMDTASLIIASTYQEVEQQYALYDNYQPRQMRVIPPGTDLAHFHPPRAMLNDAPIKNELGRFLTNPRKPMILALSRADERKNISRLIQAYGENEQLRDLANLVIIAGNRDDLDTMEKGAKNVLKGMLKLIDKYDLYGSVAYPKHHKADDVPDLYRLATRSNGIFVNPALTEPFGLTLIEAAGCGLPMVATEDGGPIDILKHCKNGLLINPLDTGAMAEKILAALSDRKRWKNWSKNGIRNAQRFYSWNGHTNIYMKEIRKLVGKKHHAQYIKRNKSRLPIIERLVTCDIDNTLLGDDDGLIALVTQLKQAGNSVGFAVATGRHIGSASRVLRQNNIPIPDIFISSVGSEIHYGKQLIKDERWEQHINYRWEPELLRQAMKDTPGLRLQAKDSQRSHKISYLINTDKAPPIKNIKQNLRKLNLHANVIYSHQAYLDLLPIRASKGQAVRYLGDKWGLAPESLLVAGDSGNDIEML
ncbi:MAG: HAD-IIB family hydrolase, partial [Gammaproteobacteria bacterium]|nr:HAD-IIB family hydrolase [Gammaproteobacteria bacterium]